jgi:hypothetical protein
MGIQQKNGKMEKWGISLKNHWGEEEMVQVKMGVKTDHKERREFHPLVKGLVTQRLRSDKSENDE